MQKGKMLPAFMFIVATACGNAVDDSAAGDEQVDGSSADEMVVSDEERFARNAADRNVCKLSRLLIHGGQPKPTIRGQGKWVSFKSSGGPMNTEWEYEWGVGQCYNPLGESHLAELWKHLSTGSRGSSGVKLWAQLEGKVWVYKFGGLKGTQPVAIDTRVQSIFFADQVVCPMQYTSCVDDSCSCNAPPIDLSAPDLQ